MINDRQKKQVSNSLDYIGYNTSLIESNRKLELQLEESEKKNSTLTTEIDKLEKTIKQLELNKEASIDSNKLSDKLKESEQKISTLTNQLGDLQKRNQELEKDLRDEKQRTEVETSKATATSITPTPNFS